jgi:hypothetical protein
MALYCALKKKSGKPEKLEVSVGKFREGFLAGKLQQAVEEKKPGRRRAVALVKEFAREHGLAGTQMECVMKRAKWRPPDSPPAFFACWEWLAKLLR